MIFNVNAAISTGANLVRNAPYNLDGSGLLVGVWAGGDLRATHQENVGLSAHATHMAGTIAALGVDSRARGMANNAKINSCYFSDSTTEDGAAHRN